MTTPRCGVHGELDSFFIAAISVGVNVWERHVEVALLEGELHRRRLREVVDDDAAVLRLRAPVVLVRREDSPAGPA